MYVLIYKFLYKRCINLRDAIILPFKKALICTNTQFTTKYQQWTSDTLFMLHPDLEGSIDL